MHTTGHTFIHMYTFTYTLCTHICLQYTHGYIIHNPTYKWTEQLHKYTQSVLNTIVHKHNYLSIVNTKNPTEHP